MLTYRHSVLSGQTCFFLEQLSYLELKDTQLTAATGTVDLHKLLGASAVCALQLSHLWRLGHCYLVSDEFCMSWTIHMRFNFNRRQLKRPTLSFNDIHIVFTFIQCYPYTTSLIYTSQFLSSQSVSTLLSPHMLSESQQVANSEPLTFCALRQL